MLPVGPEPLISLRALVIWVLAAISGVGAGIPIGLEVAGHGSILLGLFSGISATMAATLTVAGGLHQIVAQEGPSPK
jgi:hypothetical protein